MSKKDFQKVAPIIQIDWSLNRITLMEVIVVRGAYLVDTFFPAFSLEDFDGWCLVGITSLCHELGLGLQWHFLLERAWDLNLEENVD